MNQDDRRYYEACLRIADENEVKSIVFCCISTMSDHS